MLINGDEDNCKQLLNQYNKQVYSFGFEKHNDIVVSSYNTYPEYSTFTLSCHPGKTYTVPLAGKYNIANVTAALGLCYIIKKQGDFISALSTFTGIDRRFSIRGTYNDATIVDDYAHHPIEIAKTIEMARARTKGQLIVIFQPHRYSRTKALWNDFISVLRNAPCDKIIVTDIYPASEQPINEITSQQLVQQSNAQNITYIPFSTTQMLTDYVKTIAKPESMILFLGAGNEYQAGLQLLKK